MRLLGGLTTRRGSVDDMSTFRKLAKAVRDRSQTHHFGDQRRIQLSATRLPVVHESAIAPAAVAILAHPEDGFVYRR